MPGDVTVPVVLVTGFLGAGKTTFINDLLLNAGGKRIAAVVNDFGSINIDATLLENASDTVIGLKNGCICCSLQGDLLRTLRQVLGEGQPDLIVIEASGVADPQGIVQAMMDPVLFRAAALDSIVCIADADDLLGSPDRWQDPLWKAQILGSDLIQLSKIPVGDERMSSLVARLSAMGRRAIFGLDRTSAEIGDLIGIASRDRTTEPLSMPASRRFATLEWTCDGAIPLVAFQRVMQQLAPQLLRAKGLLAVTGTPGQSLLFQMVGRRASLNPSDRVLSGCALVLIGEREAFDPETARELLTRALTPDTWKPGAPI